MENCTQVQSFFSLSSTFYDISCCLSLIHLLFAAVSFAGRFWHLLTVTTRAVLSKSYLTVQWSVPRSPPSVVVPGTNDPEVGTSWSLVLVGDPGLVVMLMAAVAAEEETVSLHSS